MGKWGENVKNSAYFHIFYFTCLVICVALVVTFLIIPDCMKTSAFQEEEVISLNGVWVDGTGETVDIPCQKKTQAGEGYTIATRVEESWLRSGWIMFYSNHSYVKAYLNGELIYSYGSKEDIPFGKSPGSTWNMISILEAQEGDYLSITVTCPYDKYSGSFENIWLGTRGQLSYYVYHYDGYLGMISMVPGVAGIFIILFFLLFTKSLNKGKYIAVALAFIDISVWGMTECRAIELLFNGVTPFFAQFDNLVSFLMITPCVITAMMAMGYIENKGLYRVVCYTDCGITVVLLALQLLGIYDLSELISLVHIEMAVNLIVIVTSLFRHIGDKDRSYKVLAVLFTASGIVSGALDALNYYLFHSLPNGFFLVLEFILLMFITGGATTKRLFAMNTERIEQRVYAHMAFYDQLTGLGNGRKMERDLAKLMEEKQEATILFADMNGLKAINDNLGHSEGDRALTRMAEALMEVFGEETLLYRIGGDEYSAILPGIDLAQAEELCQAVNTRLEDASTELGSPISMAYGLSFYTGAEDLDVAECVREADHRMYEKKAQMYRESGRDRRRS